MLDFEIDDSEPCNEPRCERSTHEEPPHWYTVWEPVTHKDAFGDYTEMQPSYPVEWTNADDR